MAAIVSRPQCDGSVNFEFIAILSQIASHNMMAFSVYTSFRCTYEEASVCILKQSIEDDEDWRLVAAGVDDSLGGFDHTSLSGKKYLLHFLTFVVILKKHPNGVALLLHFFKDKNFCWVT